MLKMKTTTFLSLVTLFIATNVANASSIKFCGNNANSQYYCGPVSSYTSGACHNVASYNFWPSGSSSQVSLNDNTWMVYLQDSNCVFWADANCQGHHTKTETGAKSDGSVWFPGVCTNRSWQYLISSFKCCNGPTYCGGGTPGCT